MSIDEKALGELLVESQDLHSDARRSSRESLAAMVELGEERRAGGGFDGEERADFAAERRRLMRTTLLRAGAAGTGLGAALLRWMARPALADEALDVQMLQTSASIENLAVATYDKALALDFIGGGAANRTVRDFVNRTRDQHREHATAFNAAVTRLRGQPQTGPDPILETAVNKALNPAPDGPAAVVDLAVELETAAAQTYQSNVAALTDAQARSLTASIMGVEAQHVSFLLTVKALLGANQPDLIALDPTNAAKLPETAGTAGVPEPFGKTEKARPADEGALG
ncbi:MAG TPA: ferritin-like domain-containing protein [Acidimicrobiales bacterium]|nr:ferritin-like domain-containing protein [Acidimicrobiales bacterium]